MFFFGEPADIAFVYFYDRLKKKNNSTEQDLIILNALNKVLLRSTVKKSLLLQSFIYEIRKLAEECNPEALFFLGFCELQGIGMVANQERGIQYLKEAAHANHALALCQLGICYQNNAPSNEDQEQAFHFFSAAAKLNDPVALVALSMIYCNAEILRLDQVKKQKEQEKELVKAKELEQTKEQDQAKELEQAKVLDQAKELIHANENNDNNEFIESVESDSYNSNIDESFHQAITQIDVNLFLKSDHDTKIQSEFSSVFNLTAQGVTLHQIAASMGHAESNYRIGYYYEHGIILEKSLLKALEFYTRATCLGCTKALTKLKVHAKQGSTEAEYGLACYYGTSKIGLNITQYLTYVKRAAAKGHAAALFLLAESYETGCGVEQDEKKAKELYEASANQNYAKSLKKLADVYCFAALGLKQNYTIAFQYYNAAAKLGDEKSYYQLAVSYFNGEGVQQSNSKGMKYLQMAEPYGDKKTLFNLADIYYYGRCVTKDIDKAVQYYYLSAYLGWPKSQYNLAILYAKGNGLSKNLEKAIYWMECYIQTRTSPQQAMDASEADAKFPLENAYYALGCYYQEQGTDTALPKSVQNYMAAAKEFHIDSCYRLATFYLTGKGIAQNYEQALYYFQIAAENNHAYSTAALAALHEKGQGTKQNLDIAEKYYRQAEVLGLKIDDCYQFILGVQGLWSNIAEKSHDGALDNSILLEASKHNFPIAQFLLAKRYFNDGLCNNQDNLTAVGFFKAAAEQGHIIANSYFGIALEFDQNSDIQNSDGQNSDWQNSDKQNSDVQQAIMQQAINHYHSASNGGDAVAKFSLSVCYREGKGVNQNIEMASQYFKEAVNLSLANLPDNEKKLRSLALTKLLKEASSRGHGEAQFMLGHYYESGFINDEDNKTLPIDKAMGLYALAACKGHMRALEKLKAHSQNKDIFAQYYLGYYYCLGPIDKRDYRKAAVLFDATIRSPGNPYAENARNDLAYIAMNIQDSLAQYLFAILLLNGFGDLVKKDLVVGMRLLEEAANHNELNAVRKLAEILFEPPAGAHISWDLKRAFELFTSAACQGDAVSNERLGHFYELGIYCSEDVTKAKYYYEIAANLGNIPAMQRLAILAMKDCKHHKEDACISLPKETLKESLIEQTHPHMNSHNKPLVKIHAKKIVIVEERKVLKDKTSTSVNAFIISKTLQGNSYSPECSASNMDGNITKPSKLASPNKNKQFNS